MTTRFFSAFLTGTSTAASGLVAIIALAQPAGPGTGAPDVPPGPAAPPTGSVPSASPPTAPQSAPGASAPPLASAAPAPGSSPDLARSATGASASADGGASAATGGPAPDGGAPAAAVSSPAIEPAWNGAAPDGGAPHDTGKVAPAAGVETKRALVQRVEVGGTVSSGLDTTDSATRSGGFYGRGAYLVAEDIAIMGRYSFASGHVIERLPGNRLGQFGVPNDVDVLESRHVLEIGGSYVARLTEGEVRFFALPYLGPRLALFVNDVAPRWAFEADLALRAGAWVGDGFEASAFVAYSPAIAKATDLADVYGGVLSETRFGVDTSFRTIGPFGIALGYEGTTLTLEHAHVSTHSLRLGVNYWFR